MRCATELRRRDGFTLIELLVVIAIIAVLTAITAAAVMGLLRRGPELNAENDIDQMAVALTAMKSDLGLRSPPPSLLYLSNNRADYFSAMLPYPVLRKDSFQFLSRMFPRLNWTAMNWGSILGSATSGVILEGDQVLVFLLGGPDGLSGFSTDPTNPMAATTERKGPWFKFQPNRLIKITPVNPSPAPLILRSTEAFSYADPFKYPTKSANKDGTPYVYFSSNKRINGYNAYVSEYLGSDVKSLPAPPGPSTGFFMPYSQGGTPTRYHAADTFQIISAGNDGLLGAGGVVSPGTASPETSDNHTNFHGGVLGAAN